MDKDYQNLFGFSEPPQRYKLQSYCTLYDYPFGVLQTFYFTHNVIYSRGNIMPAKVKVYCSRIYIFQNIPKNYKRYENFLK